MRKYEILDASGHVASVIAADEDYIRQYMDGALIREAGEWEQPPNSMPEAPGAALQQPELVIKQIASSGQITINSVSDVVCPAGTTLILSGTLQGADGNIIDRTETLRVPIRASDTREKLLLASITGGLVSISAPMRESGVWGITADMINGYLPEASRISFVGISVFVVEQ